MNLDEREQGTAGRGVTQTKAQMDDLRHHRPPLTAGTEARTLAAGTGNRHSPRQDNNVMMSNDSDGNNELDDESTTTKLIGTGLRRRKGKIISCAKETIENGECLYFMLCRSGSGSEIEFP